MAYTKTKHTPGPWQVINDEGAFSELYVETSPWTKDQSIAVIRATTELQRAKARANGRLIAAAPELLAACRDIWKALDEWASEREVSLEEIADLRDQARAAIAKAEEQL